jgi:hypothetical protein
MPAKKTETKSEGGAAAKPKAAGTQPKYQVRSHDAGFLKPCSSTNGLQDMITDAIVSVLHPAPFCFGAFGVGARSASRMRHRS